MVKDPTRNSYILDLIFTNMTSHYNPPEVIVPLSTSDHNMVIWMAKIEGPEWGGGSQSHFPPEILEKSQSQLDLY